MTSTLAPHVEVWQQAYKDAKNAGGSAGDAIREADAAEAAWLAEQEDADTDTSSEQDTDNDADADVDGDDVDSG